MAGAIRADHAGAWWLKRLAWLQLRHLPPDASDCNLRVLPNLIQHEKTGYCSMLVIWLRFVRKNGVIIKTVLPAIEMVAVTHVCYEEYTAEKIISS